MKRVFLYIRVSTEEQAMRGLSIEAQTAALETWARDNGHQIAGTYTDAGISARKPASKRPELQRLLEDIRAGRGELVVFTKLDRWFRNIAEYYKVQEVLERCHVDWKTIQEDYDTSTAAGRLKINIMLSVAQDEADRTSERIKAVFQVKRQKREPLTGSCPTGYKIEGKKFVQDPETREAVAAFFRKYLASGSVSAAQEAVWTEYGKLFQSQLASKMLGSPVYYGRCYDTDGMTPPYITKAEFDLIQTMRRRTVRKTTQDRVYLFSGLAVCGECGSRLGGRTNARNRVPTYNCPGHYGRRCGCQNRTNLSESKIEAHLLDAIGPLLERARADWSQVRPKQRQRDHQGEIEALKKRLAKALDLYYSDLLTLEAYRAECQQTQARLRRLQAADAQAESGDLQALEALGSKTWREVYAGVPKEGKREFWRALLGEIRVYPDRHVEFSFKR